MQITRKRTASATVAASVLALLVSVGSASVAVATTATRWFTVQTDVSTVSVGGSPVTFVVTNCGSALAPCPGASTQSVESFDIDMPPGWTAALGVGVTPPSGWSFSVTPDGSVVQARSSGGGVRPGGTLSVALTVSPAAADAGSTRSIPVLAKQSNSFSATGSDFVLVGSAATLTVRPLYLAFSQQPRTVQVSTASSPQPMCPAVTVQVRDQAVGGHDVALAGVPVTLSSAGAADPLLSLGAARPAATGVTVSTNGAGAAVFSASPSTCAGLLAWQAGGPYTLNAASSGFLGALSAAFSVFDYYQPCPATGGCATPPGGIVGHAGTQSAVSANGAAGAFLGLSVLPASRAGSDCGEPGIAARPEVVQLDLAGGDKTLTIVWTKADTLRDPLNGTPFWPVCMTAESNFTTAAGVPAWSGAGTQPAFVSGLLPSCRAAFVTSADPCVSLSRSQAREVATIHLPSAWSGDPYYH
ncbi:MAG: hypothetical protein QOF57_1046 [Frankiaceae bacterium]|nr:hypothetical protein [Frankiaceae bacterium]